MVALLAICAQTGGLDLEARALLKLALATWCMPAEGLVVEEVVLEVQAEFPWPPRTPMATPAVLEATALQVLVAMEVEVEQVVILVRVALAALVLYYLQLRQVALVWAEVLEEVRAGRITVGMASEVVELDSSEWGQVAPLHQQAQSAHHS